jgi:glycosyltransferase involved in cell wall biosynthesis
VKLLFLSFYFEPDLCAGSFRATPLAHGLLDADPSLEVEVLTTQPNRYGSFVAEAAPVQQDGRLQVRRFAIPAHRSGMRDQSRAFLLRPSGSELHPRPTVRRRSCDVFSPDDSFAGFACRPLEGIPLYLDLRDIFVDTIGDVLPARLARSAVGPFGLLERWTIRRACRINLVSEGFREYFSTRYPDAPLSFFTNGIDDEFICLEPSPSPQAPSETIEVLYAGNVGEGQGLHLIIPALAEQLPSFRFRIIGDGGRLGALREEITQRGLTNVILHRRSDAVNW